MGIFALLCAVLGGMIGLAMGLVITCIVLGAFLPLLSTPNNLNAFLYALLGLTSFVVAMGLTVIGFVAGFWCAGEWILDKLAS